MWQMPMISSRTSRAGARGVDIGSERPVALAGLDHVGDVPSRPSVEGLHRAGHLGVLRRGVSQLNDQAARELALGLGVGGDDVGDPLRRRRRPDVGHGVGERRLERVASNGDEQVGFAGDVPVDRRHGDAGGGGDRLGGGGVESLGGEQLGSRAHDAGPGVLTASPAAVGRHRRHLRRCAGSWHARTVAHR